MTSEPTDKEAVSAAWTPLIDALFKGERRALARIVSWVEDRRPGWRDAMRQIFVHAGKATIIGITGSPGAGKSTLTGRLAVSFVERGHSVGILAVDPSSPFTGGAILGDRIRMMELARHNIFLRSMATRGALGGLSHATRDVARVLDAFGNDIVLVETVGVGQDEIDVLRVADLTVVVCIPGQGDNVQAVKAGIMEIADLFVVNKADREGADDVVGDIRAMQRLTMGKGDRQAGILKCVATTGAGTAEVVDALTALIPNVGAAANENIRREVAALVEADLLDLFWERFGARKRLVQRTDKNDRTPLDPYALSCDLLPEKALARFFAELKGKLPE